MHELLYCLSFAHLSLELGCFIFGPCLIYLASNSNYVQRQVDKDDAARIAELSLEIAREERKLSELRAEVRRGRSLACTSLTTAALRCFLCLDFTSCSSVLASLIQTAGLEKQVAALQAKIDNAGQYVFEWGQLEVHVHRLTWPCSCHNAIMANHGCCDLVVCLCQVVTSCARPRQLWPSCRRTSRKLRQTPPRRRCRWEGPTGSCMPRATSHADSVASTSRVFNPACLLAAPGLDTHVK